MTITIPPGRPTLPIEANAGGGFRSVGVVTAPALANGQSITITGADFGAVADPRPSAFDTFSDYSGLSAGQAIPVGQNWATNSDTFHSNMILDDQVTLPGRAFSTKSETKKSKLGGLLPYAGAPSKVADKYYFSFWARANENINAQPQGEGFIALKWCRLETDGLGQTRPTFEQRKQWIALELEDADVFLCPLLSEFDETDIETVPGCNNDRNTYGLDPLGVADQWVRVEFEIVSHTEAHLYVNGKEALDGVGNSIPYRKSPRGRNEIPLVSVVGTDVGSSADLNDTYRGWIAEVYEGASAARVELSNDATFDTSVEQTRHYQRCNTRTDGSIVIPDLYLGFLNPALPIYAHVINDAGTAVTSVELVVGTNVEIA